LIGLIQLGCPLIGFTLQARTLSRKFMWNMLFVGFMRFLTVILGLISLKTVAASFVETVKSSAPVFTVAAAWLMMGEKTSLLINMSLIPIMSGLALCSCNELSFTLLGFTAAFSNNICDCIQNVFSKKLLSENNIQALSANQLQFFASISALLLQIPLWLLTDIHIPSISVLPLLIVDGISFHLQSVTAYCLMNLISPVTHSVANTVKRALLIWASVMAFGNTVTLLSASGTLLVIIGVFLYNEAKKITAIQNKHLYRHTSSHSLVI